MNGKIENKKITEEQQYKILKETKYDIHKNNNNNIM